MMINLGLNFREVFKHLIPGPIRGTKFTDWIAALLQPIQTLNEDFAEWGADRRYDLSFNGQVVYLEHVLNDQFDPVDRSIYIDDPAGTQIFTPYVFNVEEQQPPLYVYNVADGLDTDENLVFYNNSEIYTTDEDFIVHVPAGIFNPINEVLMRDLIDKYRIAGKRYDFETF